MPFFVNLPACGDNTVTLKGSFFGEKPLQSYTENPDFGMKQEEETMSWIGTAVLTTLGIGLICMIVRITIWPLVRSIFKTLFK